MGEAMSNSVASMQIPLGDDSIPVRAAQPDAAISGMLPDAPLAMPTQILERPSRVVLYLRGLLQRLPGPART